MIRNAFFLLAVGFVAVLIVSKLLAKLAGVVGFCKDDLFLLASIMFFVSGVLFIAYLLYR